MTAHIIEPLADDRRAPLGITAINAPARLEDFVHHNLAWLQVKIREHGAVLFRGYGVDNAARLGEFVAALGGRSTPDRFGETAHARAVRPFHALSEYPAQVEIPLHSESTCDSSWPRQAGLLLCHCGCTRRRDSHRRSA